MRIFAITLVLMLCGAKVWSEARLQGKATLNGKVSIGTTNAPPAPPTETNFFYVSSAGDNANTGTTTSDPWLTVAKGLTNLVAGKTLALRGGDTFNETGLVLRTNGTALAPIRLTSYGTGLGQIKNTVTNENALTIVNSEWIQVDNLKFTGQTNWGMYDLTNTWGHAIYFQNTNSSGYLDSCSVSNCVITNAYGGLMMWSKNANVGYSNVRIVGNTMTNLIMPGVRCHSQVTIISQCFTNLYVGYNRIGYIHGGGDSINQHGTPLSVKTAINSIVEHNYFYQSGETTGHFSGGAGGIVLSYSRDVITQWNEADHIYSNLDGVDGIGFDFDTACTNCTFQYNYAHDCGGAGYYFFGAGGGNTVRWNLGVNNNVNGNQSGIYFKVGSSNWKIYNNTIIALTAANEACIELGGLTADYGGTNYILNNLLMMHDGYQILSGVSGQAAIGTIAISGNDYWDAFKNRWGPTTYTDLPTFRTGTGQETGTGLNVEPIIYADMAYTVGDLYDIDGYTNHRLLTNSPCIGAGIDIATAFGLNVGTNDLAKGAIAVPYSIGCYNAGFTPNWTPTNIAGCILWVSADDGTYSDAGSTPSVNGGLVQQWNDRSGNGFHFTSPSSTTKPSVFAMRMGTKPTILFDATSDYFTNNFAGTKAQPLTYFVVCRVPNTAAARDIVDGRDASNRNLVALTLTSDVLATFAGTTLNGPVPPMAQRCLFTSYFSGASSYARTNRVDAMSGDAGTQGVIGLTVNSRYSLDQAWGGLDLGEILVYNATLSDSDRTLIETYMRNRWGTP